MIDGLTSTPCAVEFSTTGDIYGEGEKSAWRTHFLSRREIEPKEFFNDAFGGSDSEKFLEALKEEVPEPCFRK